MTTPLVRRSICLLGVALATSACAAGPRPLDRDPAIHRSITSRMVTADRISRSGAQNAWEAIRRVGRVRLRENEFGQPTRISSTRGNSSIVLDDAPIVLLDGVRLVDFALLRQVRANTISSIEFLNSSEATVRHGTGATGGAILVVTRTARDASL